MKSLNKVRDIGGYWSIFFGEVNLLFVHKFFTVLSVSKQICQIPLPRPPPMLRCMTDAEIHELDREVYKCESLRKKLLLQNICIAIRTLTFQRDVKISIKNDRNVFQKLNFLMSFIHITTSVAYFQ